MFYYTGLTSWTTELPNLTEANCMFGYCSSLTSFTVALPAIHSADGMFLRCHLDIDSLRCIAEGINDVNNVSEGIHNIGIGLSYDAFHHSDKQKYVDILNAKGWSVAISLT